MALFSTLRRKRRTAVVVLLAGLFTLVSGFANACLLETPASHAAGAQAAPAGAEHADAGWVAQHEAAAGHEEHPDGSRAACLKACDDGTHTLSKADAGVDQHEAGPAPLVATLWLAALPVVLVPQRAEELQLPSREPPLRVRYSRLTL